MATAHRSCTGTAQLGTTATLVAARPIAQRLCFQSVSLARCQQRAAGGRSLPKTMAAAAVDPTVEEPRKLPPGLHRYETMIILKPTLSDEERDRELAKFEAYLNKQECYEINALVRGRSRLAYPIKKEWEGIFVLYSYVATRQTGRAVQLLLSKPEAGAEDTVLRHITLCKQ